jgi:sorbitol/mannitol transport system permease protein
VSVQLTVLPVLGIALLGPRSRSCWTAVPRAGRLRTLLITPFLMMPVVVGLIWKNQMFHGLYGVLNWVIEKLGGTRSSSSRATRRCRRSSS